MSNQASAKDCVMSFKAVPNASRTELRGWLGDAIKIRVQSPPEDGKANKAIVKFLSKQLKTERNAVLIEGGAFQPLKRIRFVGMSREEVLEKLQLTP